MKQEIQDLKETINKVEKENEMMFATVDEKIGENLRLETELQTTIEDRLLKTRWLTVL